MDRAAKLDDGATASGVIAPSALFEFG